MLASVRSCAVVGLDAVVVEVEVDSANGLPSITVVGLPDQAVKESRDRLLAAVTLYCALIPLSYSRKFTLESRGICASAAR